MASDALTLYKLIVLYILEQVSFPLTTSQVSELVLEKEYTSYLTLQQVISELSEANLILAITKSNRTLLSITPEGSNTLSFFGNRVSDIIKTEIKNYFVANKIELRNEVSIVANYYKSVSGEYETSLIAKEKELLLVDIKLSVPTEEIALSICDNWQNKNQEIYQYLMEQLL